MEYALGMSAIKDTSTRWEIMIYFKSKYTLVKCVVKENISDKMV